LGAIGEFIGSLAVLVTLVYLSIQIRQNNKMARFWTMREYMAQYNACNQLYATDATIRHVLLKSDELILEEVARLYSYVDMYCNALSGRSSNRWHIPIRQYQGRAVCVMSHSRHEI
jgi:hypothetical protein